MPGNGLGKIHGIDPGRLTPARSPFFSTLIVGMGIASDPSLDDLFRDGEHMVLKAQVPEEALAKARQFQPDLILLQFSQGSDWNLLHDLLMEQASAAVIVLSRNPSVPEAVEAMKHGAVDYLDWPSDPQKLKAAIDLQKALFSSL